MRSNRNTGMMLILLTEQLRYTYTAAYRLVYPERKCSDASAADYVRKLKKHHRKTYPLSINEALEVNGVTIEGIVEDIQDARTAMKPRWNPKTNDWEASSFPDYATRARARRELRDWVNLDQKVRQELAVGKAEMARMQLNTGPKFDTIQEWTEWMETQHEVTMKGRAGGEGMRVIAAGRQIERRKDRKRWSATASWQRRPAITGDEPLDKPATNEASPAVVTRPQVLRSRIARARAAVVEQRKGRRLRSPWEENQSGGPRSIRA